jgi:non-specific serine/threonine protein kinase
MIAPALQRLALVDRRHGSYASARARYLESLDVSQQLGDLPAIAAAFEGLVAVAVGLGEPGRSLQLAGAASALRVETGIPLPPPDRKEYERHVASARAALGIAAAVAWETGQARPLEQAIAYAWSERNLPQQVGQVAEAVLPKAVVAPAARDAGSSPLTAREHEVATLIMDGLTNREIAAHLVITERTAASHVEHILAKLGLRNRAQITAWLAKHGAAAPCRPLASSVG